MRHLLPNNISDQFFLFMFLAMISGCGNTEQRGFCPSTINPFTSGSLQTTLTGQATYEDKVYDPTGRFTTQFNPIRYASVEVVRCFDNQVLATGSTTGTGTYAVSFSNQGFGGVYVRVLSKTDPSMATSPNGSLISVRNNPSSRAIYGLTSPPMNDDNQGGTLSINLSALASPGIGGVFNILDKIEVGAAYLRMRQPNSVLPPITVYWEAGSKDGTYFNGGDLTIHLAGETSVNSDEYNDSVILHEYGHYAEEVFSRVDFPGENHSFGDSTQDIRLSWGEGFATFFSSAVRNNPFYIDAQGNTVFSFNIDAPDADQVAGIPILNDYSTNETAVSAVLWDIFAPSLPEDPSTESLNLGINPIWDVFSQWMPTQSTATLETFWDGFINLHSGEKEPARLILLERLIEYDDRFPSPKQITTGTIYHSILYPSGKIDQFQVNLVPGEATLATKNLTNGADTYLELRDSNNFLLASNDNGKDTTDYSSCGASPSSVACPLNDGTSLAASLTYNIPASGIYYVFIKKSPKSPPSAGKYGSYDFIVTQP